MVDLVGWLVGRWCVGVVGESKMFLEVGSKERETNGGGGRFICIIVGSRNRG